MTDRSQKGERAGTARRKEFDPEAAPDVAMRLFWRNGYEGTSTGDLVDELDIARASPYGTYGSERGLYPAALDRFLSGAAGPSTPDIPATRTSALDAVRDLLGISAAAPKPDTPRAVSRSTPRGAWRFGPEDRAADRGQPKPPRDRAPQRAAEAHAEGEQALGVDPRSAATMPASLNSGLKVLSCAGADQRDRFTASVNAVMAMLTPRAAVGTD
ncbi:TetR/AcrR family transcriptional regulator [Streptomyces sp. DSM 118878]